MEEVGGLAPSPDGESATLTEVLDHGGWLLIDPRPVAAEHPDTFELPSGDDLGALGPGSGIKAMLRCADLADPVRDGLAAYGPDGRPQLALVTERMWLLVLGRDGDRLDCVLDNAPYAAYTRLVPGARISVPLTHVIDTAEGVGPDDLAAYLAESESVGLPLLAPEEVARPEDPTRWPTVRDDQSQECRRAGVWPEPPWMFSSMIVSADLAPDRFPLKGARFDAQPDRHDNGWVVFAGRDTMDEVQDGPGFEVVTLQEAHRRHPGILRYLALPEGWGFTVTPAGDEVHPVEIEA